MPGSGGGLGGVPRTKLIYRMMQAAGIPVGGPASAGGVPPSPLSMAGPPTIPYERNGPAIPPQPTIPYEKNGPAIPPAGPTIGGPSGAHPRSPGRPQRPVRPQRPQPEGRVSATTIPVVGEPQPAAEDNDWMADAPILVGNGPWRRGQGELADLFRYQSGLRNEGKLPGGRGINGLMQRMIMEREAKRLGAMPEGGLFMSGSNGGAMQRFLARRRAARQAMLDKAGVPQEAAKQPSGNTGGRPSGSRFQ